MPQAQLQVRPRQHQGKRLFRQVATQPTFKTQQHRSGARVARQVRQIAGLTRPQVKGVQRQGMRQDAQRAQPLVAPLLGSHVCAVCGLARRR